MKKAPQSPPQKGADGSLRRLTRASNFGSHSNTSLRINLDFTKYQAPPSSHMNSGSLKDYVTPSPGIGNNNLDDDPPISLEHVKVDLNKISEGQKESNSVSSSSLRNDLKSSPVHGAHKRNSETNNPVFHKFSTPDVDVRSTMVPAAREKKSLKKKSHFYRDGKSSVQIDSSQASKSQVQLSDLSRMMKYKDDEDIPRAHSSKITSLINRHRGPKKRHESNMSMDILMTKPKMLIDPIPESPKSNQPPKPLAQAVNVERNLDSLLEEDDMDSDSMSTILDDKANLYRSQTFRELDTRSDFLKSLDNVRKGFTLSQGGTFYQLFAFMSIILSFSTSFGYAYYSAFLPVLDEGQRDFFIQFDQVCTIFFIIDFVISIFVDEHNTRLEGYWTLKKSCTRQLRGRLLWDIVAIAPFADWAKRVIYPQGVIPDDREKLLNLLYAIKLVRLSQGFELLDYRRYKKQLLASQGKRIESLLHTDLKDDKIRDHAQISRIVLISKILKISRLVFMMMCLSYFTGIFWYVFCTYVDPPENPASSFMTNFSFEESYTSHYKRISVLTYYAFTTLSTVGLGDFHPRQSHERILCAIIMFGGAMITSNLMDNFREMVQELRNLNSNYDDSDRFNLFLGTMKHLNEGVRLRKSFELQMESYFAYRWKFDKNLAISQENDYDLLEQLPGKIQTQIYVKYLFDSFMTRFARLLNLRQDEADLRRQFMIDESRQVNAKFEIPIDMNRFYMRDHYDTFIIEFLRLLEPIEVFEGQIIQREERPEANERRVNEIYFLMNGRLSVGYNLKKMIMEQRLDSVELPINQDDPMYPTIQRKVSEKLIQEANGMKTPAEKHRFPVAFEKKGQVVGLFEIMYDKPSQFYYKVKMGSNEGDVDLNNCYFIRKFNWLKFQKRMEDEEELQRLYLQFQTNVIANYAVDIYLPIKKDFDGWMKTEIQLQCENFNLRQVENSVIKSLFKQHAHFLLNRPSLASKHHPRRVESESDISHSAFDFKESTRSMIITTDLLPPDEQQFTREAVADLIQEKRLSKKHEIRKRLNIILYNELQADKIFASRNLLDRFRQAYDLHLRLGVELSINVRTLYTRNKTLMQEVTRLHSTQQNQMAERSRLWEQIKEKDEEIGKLKDELSKKESANQQLREEVKLLKISNTTQKQDLNKLYTFTKAVSPVKEEKKQHLPQSPANVENQSISQSSGHFVSESPYFKAGMLDKNSSSVKTTDHEDSMTDKPRTKFGLSAAGSYDSVRQRSSSTHQRRKPSRQQFSRVSVPLESISEIKNSSNASVITPQNNHYNGSPTRRDLVPETCIAPIEITSIRSGDYSISITNPSVDYNLTVQSKGKLEATAKQLQSVMLSQSSLISNQLTDPMSQQRSDDTKSLKRLKFVREIKKPKEKKLTILNLEAKNTSKKNMALSEYNRQNSPPQILQAAVNDVMNEEVQSNAEGVHRKRSLNGFPLDSSNDMTENLRQPQIPAMMKLSPPPDSVRKEYAREYDQRPPEKQKTGLPVKAKKNLNSKPTMVVGKAKPTAGSTEQFSGGKLREYSGEPKENSTLQRIREQSSRRRVESEERKTEVGNRASRDDEDSWAGQPIASNTPVQFQIAQIAEESKKRKSNKEEQKEQPIDFGSPRNNAHHFLLQDTFKPQRDMSNDLRKKYEANSMQSIILLQNHTHEPLSPSVSNETPSTFQPVVEQQETTHNDDTNSIKEEIETVSEAPVHRRSSPKTSTSIAEKLSQFEKSNIGSSKKDSGESKEALPIEEEIQEDIREETDVEPPRYISVQNVKHIKTEMKQQLRLQKTNNTNSLSLRQRNQFSQSSFHSLSIITHSSKHGSNKSRRSSQCSSRLSINSKHQRSESIHEEIGYSQ